MRARTSESVIGCRSHPRTPPVTPPIPLAVLAAGDLGHGDVATVLEGLKGGVDVPDAGEGVVVDAAEVEGGEHVAGDDGTVVVDRELREHTTTGGQVAHLPAL